MIEKIARTLCEVWEVNPESGPRGKPAWKAFIPEATAVVRAMREPDSKMSARLDLALADWVQDIGDNEDVWRVAIDSILSQPQEEKVK